MSALSLARSVPRLTQIQPSVAFKPDAVALALGVHDRAERVFSGGRADVQRHAIGKRVFDFIFAEGRIAAGNRLRRAVCLRPRPAPAGRWPRGRCRCGARPSRSSCRRNIRTNNGTSCGSAPGRIPRLGAWPCQKSQLRSSGTGAVLNGPPRRPAGSQTLTCFELADPAVAHQFARQAEPRIAALLRAGLEDGLVFAHGFRSAACPRQSSASAASLHRRLCRPWWRPDSPACANGPGVAWMMAWISLRSSSFRKSRILSAGSCHPW